MIALVSLSAITLSMLQASVAAPTQSFRSCLREAATKATSEKVSGDNIEAYLRNACTAQMSTLRDALIAFRLKNGMTKKAASADAEMTVDDYVSTPADNYKFIANMNSPKSTATPTQPAAAQPSAGAQPKP